MTPFFLAIQILAAVEPVPTLTGPVVNLAEMIDSRHRAQLEELARTEKESNGVRLQILTVPSIGDEPIEQFSVRVAEAWKIAVNGNDNGILIVVAKAERKFRIEVGGGLEGDLTDIQAKRILDDTLTPAFARGDYGGGLYSAAVAALRAVPGQQTPQPDVAGGGATVDLSTDDVKTDYALGFTVGNNIARGKPFAPDRAAAISNGLDDALSGKSAQVDMPTYGPKVQQMMSARTPPPPGLAEEKKKGTDFADTAAQQPGAEKLASGLVFKSITAGSGANPTAADVVQVNYEGKLTDGTVFDASAKHGGPATFPLNHVIPCWTEGVQKLKMGGKAELICPSSIAYGDMGHPPTIPGGATLVFTVELLGINRAGAQPGAAKAKAKEEKAEKRRDASLLVCNAHYWRRKIQQEYATARYGGVIDMEEVYFDEQQAAAEEPDENLAEAKKWLRENHVKPIPCRSFTLYDDGRYQDAATDGDMTNKADPP